MSKIYTVLVVRTGYAFREMEIKADSKKAAKAAALDLAGDLLFSENQSDYKVDYIKEAGQ